MLGQTLTNQTSLNPNSSTNRVSPPDRNEAQQIQWHLQSRKSLLVPLRPSRNISQLQLKRTLRPWPAKIAQQQPLSWPRGHSALKTLIKMNKTVIILCIFAVFNWRMADAKISLNFPPLTLMILLKNVWIAMEALHRPPQPLRPPLERLVLRRSHGGKEFCGAFSYREN